MEFEIIERQNDIVYDVPRVDFPAYEEYLDKAQQIADYIRSIEVTQETIKDAKKTLADARKLTDRLNRFRIDMKKEILKNYDTVEAQIKEISGVVDRADKEVRAKVKELDEAERKAKEGELRAIWEKRSAGYEEVIAHIPDAFEKWLQPTHLNKSTALSKAEADMVSWLEATSKDLTAAANMGDEYVVKYVVTGDLASAIEAVNAENVIRTNVVKVEEEQEEKATFEIYGTKDIKLTEMLLEEHEINYTRR